MANQFPEFPWELLGKRRDEFQQTLDTLLEANGCNERTSYVEISVQAKREGAELAEGMFRIIGGDEGICVPCESADETLEELEDVDLSPLSKTLIELREQLHNELIELALPGYNLVPSVRTVLFSTTMGNSVCVPGDYCIYRPAKKKCWIKRVVLKSNGKCSSYWLANGECTCP